MPECWTIFCLVNRFGFVMAINQWTQSGRMEFSPTPLATVVLRDSFQGGLDPLEE